MVADIQNLTVRYGAFVALDRFTVQLPEGCVGLLGPNGAGKTTLLKTLLGFVKPAAGTGTVNGHDIVRDALKVRQSVGYMPEQDCHIPGISAVQFVAYAGELAGLPPSQALRRAHEVLEYSGLGEARYRAVETYSTGMKQRIKLAQALVHGPRLLLLDEPTNGLDPRGREEMLNLVRQIATEQHVNVIVSSHLLPDIERTCDHVVVVVQGHLAAQGPIRDLRSVVGEPTDVELREPSPAFAAALEQAGLQVLHQDGVHLRVQGVGTLAQTAQALFLAAVSARAQIRSFAPAKRSLEEAFLEAVRG